MITITSEEIIANEKYHTCSRCKWVEFPFICHTCKWGEDVREDRWRLKDELAESIKESESEEMTNEEDIAKAFQLGFAFGFVENCDNGDAIKEVYYNQYCKDCIRGKECKQIDERLKELKACREAESEE